LQHAKNRTGRALGHLKSPRQICIGESCVALGNNFENVESPLKRWIRFVATHKDLAKNLLIKGAVKHGTRQPAHPSERRRFMKAISQSLAIGLAYPQSDAFIQRCSKIIFIR
jgi:hypothetical protein